MGVSRILQCVVIQFTIRDRDDIGWFVVYCIKYSQSNKGVSGVASRVIGRM